jgi:hypothetical protein
MLSLKKKISSVSLIISTLTPLSMFSTDYTVNLSTDSSYSSGGSGSGTSGDFRYVLNQILNNQAQSISTSPHSITFSVPSVTWSESPPPINSFQADTITIGNSSGSPTTISGNDQVRPFFIDQGTVTLQNLNIVNGKAQGGSGGPGGGGGLGAGGAIFVNAADVSLNNVTLSDCSALAGLGGSQGAGGGGGGLGGNGGSSVGGGGGLSGNGGSNVGGGGALGYGGDSIGGGGGAILGSTGGSSGGVGSDVGSYVFGGGGSVAAEGGGTSPGTASSNSGGGGGLNGTNASGYIGGNGGIGGGGGAGNSPNGSNGSSRTSGTGGTGGTSSDASGGVGNSYTAGGGGAAQSGNGGNGGQVTDGTGGKGGKAGSATALNGGSAKGGNGGNGGQVTSGTGGNGQSGGNAFGGAGNLAQGGGGAQGGNGGNGGPSTSDVGGIGGTGGLATAGNGGFGGGGGSALGGAGGAGGRVTSGSGGNGGAGGAATAGSGGFGGGGGAAQAGPGGNGGAVTSGTRGKNGTSSNVYVAGFGGAGGSDGNAVTSSSSVQGGDGAAMGGAIFVNDNGTLSISGNSSFTNNSVSSNNGKGISIAEDIFLLSGSTITLSPSTGSTYTLTSIIADDSSNSILSGQTWNPGNGPGATVVKAGDGTLNLLAANSFSGGTIQQGGTLFLGDSLSLGYGSLTMSSDTTLSLNENVSLSNPISLSTSTNTLRVDAGDASILSNLTGDSDTTVLYKLGSGTLTLYNKVTVSEVFINEGSLIMAPGSSLDPLAITVSQGASIGGIGEIIGDLTNAGRLYVGSETTSGVLEIVGNVTFEPGSSLDVFLSNTGESSLVTTGDVTIGSNVYLDLYFSDNYTLGYNQYALIQASSITGQFSLITGNTNPILQVQQTLSNGQLILDVSLRPFGEYVSPSNALNVGQAIRAVAISGNTTLNDVVASLISLDNTQLVGTALNQMQPALYKALAISQENNAVKVRDSLSYRFEQVLNEIHCLAYKPLSNSDEKKPQKPNACKSEDKTVDIWMNGFGDILYQGSNTYAGSPQVGYQTKTYGITLGIDGNFAKYFYVGALGAYTDSDITWHNNQGNGDIQTGYGGLYFSAISEMFYGNLSVIGGWSHYDAHRYIRYTGVDEKAENSHGGAQILSHADTGLNLGWKGFTIRPFDSFDYISQTENGYTEKEAGDFNLYVKTNNAIMLRNELGIQFASCLCFNSSKWTISPKISWVREVRIKGSESTAEFVNTNIEFQSTGYFPNRSLVSPGLLITGLMCDELLALNLYYNGEYRHNYSDYNYGGQIRFRF